MFQHRIIESRPAEYKRPVFLSNWSAFTPDRWRGSCSSLMVKDTVTFLLGMVWLCGWVCEWPEQGRTPAAILHFFFCQLLFSFPIRHSRALSIVSSRNVTQRLACVASVSVRFSSKERGRRVKDRGKNGASKTAGRGWGIKEGNACRQTPWFWKPPTWLLMPEFDAVISCDDWPIKCLSFRGAVMNFRGACVKPEYFFCVFWNAWTALMVKSSMNPNDQCRSKLSWTKRLTVLDRHGTNN